MIHLPPKSAFIRYMAGLSLALGPLQACQQIIQVQPTPAMTAVVDEPVPTTLLTTARLDSVITLHEPIDFSVVNRSGQGPKGSLLFWGNRDSPGRWSSYTYDEQGRLIGVFTSDYTTQKMERAVYQGSYLAEDYVQGLDGRLLTLKRYRYDVQGHKRQTLLYSGSNDQPGVFWLRTKLDHDYDAQGQLLTVRMQSRDLPNSYWLYFWEHGDCVRQEEYTIDTDTKAYDLRTRVVLEYTNQTDPVYTLPLYDEYTVQPSQHLVSSTTQHIMFRGVEQIMPGCTLTNQFIYDVQGRLSQRRTTPGNLWDYYRYAP